MTLETERLILRPWRASDAESLFEYAQDPRIGPITGWPVHTSIEDSRVAIRDVLMADEMYAVTLRGEDRAIGSIGLSIGEKSNMKLPPQEGEIGYWIGVPYWGQGLIPEATQVLQQHAFEDLGLRTLWCGYFDGNIKSKRAQEKVGFHFHHTEVDKPWPLMNDIRTEHITCLTREEWKNARQ